MGSSNGTKTMLHNSRVLHLFFHLRDNHPPLLATVKCNVTGYLTLTSYCSYVNMASGRGENQSRLSGTSVPTAGGSELTLFQNLLHCFSKGHLSVAAGQTFPGPEVQSGDITAHHTLNFNLSSPQSLTSSLWSSLTRPQLVVVGAGVVIAIAKMLASASAFPYELQRSAFCDLEVTGEEEELPALLQLSLDLNLLLLLAGS